MELYFLLLLVVIMAFALGSGYPVAFALPGAAIITIAAAAISGYLFAGDTDAYFASGGPSQWLSAGVTNLRGVYWEPDRDTLIAIPLFIFMGIMLQRSKIAEDLLVTMAQLFGPVPGGLGISVVFVGALLAATTGIVGATVVAMGLISLPAMMQRGYSNPLATGTIAASGTLGQIIPPSIVLIILADQLASAVDQADTSRKELYKEATGEIVMPSEYGVVSTSAGDMFLGALVPGLLLVGLYIAFILAFALVRPKLAPPVPYDGKYDARFAGKVALALIPPLLLIFLVLGSIIGGIATVNQAGAIGAVGAMIMAGYRLHKGGALTFVPAIMALIGLAIIGYVLANYDTNIKAIDTPEDVTGVTLALIGVGITAVGLLWSGWRTYTTDDTLQGVMVETAKTTSLVFIILLGAAMLTAAFRAFGGEELVKHFLEGLPGGFWTRFVIVMLVIFVLGFFLDFIEIAVVVVPIVAPILLADPGANVTAVWLGVMIGLNIQTSFLTPPFGFALFYLRGVAPAAVRTIQMYKGVIAFISLQLIALVIVGFNPSLVNYLPTRSSLTAETAPPPLNPRLQYCMENFIHEQFTENRAELEAAIGRMEGVDLSYLPEDLREEFEEGLENARESFEHMAEIKAVEQRLDEGAGDYRPAHTLVRALQRDARQIDAVLEDLRQSVNFAQGNEELIADAEAEIVVLEADKEALLAQIPGDWTEVQEAYVAITRDDRNARNAYRRSVDAAYKPVMELSAILADTDALLALEEPLRELEGEWRNFQGEAAEERFAPIEQMIGAIEGAGDIRSGIAGARRDIDDDTPDYEDAEEEFAEGMEAFEFEKAWRLQAREAGLLAVIEEYDAAIQNTIGLRQQSRLPREQALYVAACSADHRDISLNF
ncbi:MAG: TRAP transporter large permease subunit [Pseudomonadota bacterium]